MVIIAAVLFALGVFDVSNFVGSKAAGFSGVAVTGWKLDTAGVLHLKVANQVGQKINITQLNATFAGVTSSNNSGIELATGEMSEEITLAGYGTPTVNSGYTAAVIIAYTDLNSQFDYTTSGTLTGRVS